MPHVAGQLDFSANKLEYLTKRIFSLHIARATW
jgi:hypothetical protein